MKGEKMRAVLIKNFPDDLHHKAKVQAALEQTTLKDLFAKAMREYLRRAGVPGLEADRKKED